MKLARDLPQIEPRPEWPAKLTEKVQVYNEKRAAALLAGSLPILHKPRRRTGIGMEGAKA